MDTIVRPWGHYQVLLHEPGLKVKQIIVKPGQRLSLQRHRHRSEHWNVIHGEAVVSFIGGEKRLPEGASLDIPIMSWHRIKNDGEDDVVIIEIQTGVYLGEDDIERIDDDYGRVSG